MLRTLFLVKGVREFTRGGYERASRSFDDGVMQRSLAGRRAMVTGEPRWRRDCLRPLFWLNESPRQWETE